MKIRDATAADLPAVSKLAGALVRLHHSWDTRRFMLIEPVESGYQRFLSSQVGQPEVVLLVAEMDGAVAGYLYGGLEDRDWMALRDRCGAVYDVFVDEAHRHAGVATALMKEGLARLKAAGAPRVVLMSAQANTEGQALFEKLGFRRTMVELTVEL